MRALYVFGFISASGSERRHGRSECKFPSYKFAKCASDLHVLPRVAYGPSYVLCVKSVDCRWFSYTTWLNELVR